MFDKPWRSRFTRRLATRVSRVEIEAAAPRQRLFPYGIADTRADRPSVTPPPKLIVPDVKKKIVRPERKVETGPGWQFKKR